MRDRRNTSLSVSSTSSSASTPSERNSLNEKRLPTPLLDDDCLPPPVTKENRPRRQHLRSMALKVLLAVCCVLLLWRLSIGWPIPSRYTSHNVLSDGLVAGDSLPEEPTTLIVSAVFGQAKWTVSIPHNASFPLSGKQYADICTEGDALKNQFVKESRIARFADLRRKPSYYSQDRTFLDVAEAEASGALPPAQDLPTDVCNSSLTFVMDTANASFGKTLLMLWLSYGLAMKEGRAFFVDDTRWPYGKYSSYFAPVPDQRCSPPPRHYVLPCPHQAKHLVVSAATVPWTFGALFEQEFTQQRAQGAERQQRIFDLLRSGYESLFTLVGEDASYAQSRVGEMRKAAGSHAGSVVGMHVRRGDLHPHEYQFSGDYIPLERYAAGARSLFHDLLASRQSTRNNTDVSDFTAVMEYVRSPLLLASDDPEVLGSPELSQAASPFTIQRAQERIQLATKATLDQTSPVQPLREPGSAYLKHIDENTGWEGGFYSALFYSLGNSKTTPGSDMLERLHPLPGAADAIPEQAVRMRELVGRAYLLDLAVLGRSDGVVCAVSSASCRILGVMMGWDAVRDGRWVNVDDDRPWTRNGSR